MRILFLSGMTHDRWGGSEVLWSEAAAEMAVRGHTVSAIVEGWPETPAPVRRLRERGVTVWERSHRLPVRALNFVARRLGLQKHLCLTWRKVRSFAPDLVCVSNAGVIDGAAWMMRCLEDGIPYCSIAQANSETWWPEDGQFDYLRKAYQGAREAFFVSHQNLELFQRQIAQKLPRARVISNPFTVDWEADCSWPRDSSVLKLACVARLYPPAKSQDLLFEVISQEKWKHRPFKVTLFGQGPMQQALRGLAELKGLSGIVEFAGQVSDVATIWRSHHALVLPSRYEGQPLSLIESMICGRPSISTMIGSANLVQDNVTGFLARTPTIEDLDEAMERAWAARDDWPLIGRRARETAELVVPRNPAAELANLLAAQGP